MLTVCTETARIAAELRRAANGPAWHGPALLEALADVTPSQAAARPLPAAHSIWEIALHAATWLDILHERTDGQHRDGAGASRGRGDRTAARESQPRA